jgi:hypothetical protein
MWVQSLQAQAIEGPISTAMVSEVIVCVSCCLLADTWLQYDCRI